MLFHNVGLFPRLLLCNMIQTTHTMQHWHQPKHIIYDTTESYILLLNSPYSIFEHLLPQCTAHYQGYRSKTHTHAVWTHQHHEDAFYVEMVWSYYCSSAVRRVPVQLSRFWLGFTADVCRVSSHSAADGVSAGRLSLHNDWRKAVSVRLIYCGNKEGCSSFYRTVYL